MCPVSIIYCLECGGGGGCILWIEVGVKSYGLSDVFVHVVARGMGLWRGSTKFGLDRGY